MKDPTYAPTYPLIDLQPDTPLQVIYDTVKEHLLRQGVRSSFGEACRYRGPDGTACAVGCLLKDEDVGEGVNVYGLPACRVLSHKTFSLLSDLQLVHDSRQPEAWPAMLAELATRYGLTP